MQRSQERGYLKHGTLVQMRALQMVARHGSFSRAAEELHMAQPTVSLQIKKLTETVGMPLLESVGKRVYPTAAGRALGSVCEQIIEAFVRFDDTLADLRGLKSGTLRIAIGTAEKYVVAPLLAGLAPAGAGNLRALYPADRVELWLDQAALVPLAVAVTAAPGEERRAWAAARSRARRSTCIRAGNTFSTSTSATTTCGWRSACQPRPATSVGRAHS